MRGGTQLRPLPLTMRTLRLGAVGGGDVGEKEIQGPAETLPVSLYDEPHVIYCCRGMCTKL